MARCPGAGTPFAVSVGAKGTDDLWTHVNDALRERIKCKCGKEMPADEYLCKFHPESALLNVAAAKDPNTTQDCEHWITCDDLIAGKDLSLNKLIFLPGGWILMMMLGALGFIVSSCVGASGESVCGPNASSNLDGAGSEVRVVSMGAHAPTACSLCSPPCIPSLL